MDDLKKVTAGEKLKIPAGTWNAFIDAARYVRDRASSQHVDKSVSDTKPGMIHVRNDSGADIATMNAVLGLDGLVFTPTSDPNIPIVFKGINPDKAKHRGKFCVLAEPVAKGGVALAFVDVVTTVRLNVPIAETAEQSPFAEIVDGQKYLAPACYGSARILYREGSYGEMWAVVRLGVTPATFQVKLVQAAGAQGTSTTPATWTYQVKDSYTDEALTTVAVNPVSSPHKFVRPPVGQMIKATYGLARFDKDGKIVLNWINEIPDQEKC